MTQVGKGLSQQEFWDRHQLGAIGPDNGRLNPVAGKDFSQHRRIERHLAQIRRIGGLDMPSR